MKVYWNMRRYSGMSARSDNLTFWTEIYSRTIYQPFVILNCAAEALFDPLPLEDSPSFFCCFREKSLIMSLFNIHEPFLSFPLVWNTNQIIQNSSKNRDECDWHRLVKRLLHTQLAGAAKQREITCWLTNSGAQLLWKQSLIQEQKSKSGACLSTSKRSTFNHHHARNNHATMYVYFFEKNTNSLK